MTNCHTILTDKLNSFVIGIDDTHAHEYYYENLSILEIAEVLGTMNKIVFQFVFSFRHCFFVHLRFSENPSLKKQN